MEIKKKKENRIPNKSIECTVIQCANHCGDQDYCALDKIRVITHEQNPTVIQCTDCGSFVLDSVINQQQK